MRGFRFSRRLDRQGRKVVSSAPAETAPATKPKQATRQPDNVYVPTPQFIVDTMLEMAEVKRGNVV